MSSGVENMSFSYLLGPRQGPIPAGPTEGPGQGPGECPGDGPGPRGGDILVFHDQMEFFMPKVRFSMTAELVFIAFREGKGGACVFELRGRVYLSQGGVCI